MSSYHREPKAGKLVESEGAQSVDPKAAPILQSTSGQVLGLLPLPFDPRLDKSINAMKKYIAKFEARKFLIGSTAARSLQPDGPFSGCFLL